MVNSFLFILTKSEYQSLMTGTNFIFIKNRSSQINLFSMFVS